MRKAPPKPSARHAAPKRPGRPVHAGKRAGGGGEQPRSGKSGPGSQKAGDAKAGRPKTGKHHPKRAGQGQEPAAPTRGAAAASRPERTAEGRERPEGSRPFRTRAGGSPAHGDRPREDRTQGERPQRERPQGERRGSKPSIDIPYHERPGRRRPDGGKPFRDRQAGDRPAGDRSAGNRSAGNRSGREQARERPNIRPGASRLVLRGSIQLLQGIEARHEPADRVIHAWMKSNHRRFDAREREALIQTVEDCLRQRARLDWWIERHGRGEVQPEAALRVAALKILVNGSKAAPICKSLEWGEGSPLAECLMRLEGHTLEHPDMPDAVRFNVPAWIMPRFVARFGADLPLEMAAALRPAPLDLRVNALKTSRAAAAAALAAEQQRVAEMPISPWGLRLGPQSYVNDGAAFAEGLIEPQDEGSQIASLLVDAGQARLVVDFCAGAGGKTLAVAATMRNNGRLIACDVSEKRLARAKQRLRRAGVHNAECRLLDAKWVKRQAGMADRVLVDAPCSGTGTWRRKPDARWRLTETDIRELVAKQADILARASRLVAPGGRLIYVTCSVLTEENEAQVTAFLAQHPDFTMLPVADIWPRLFATACPASQPWLQLTPGRHGTDGFFVAVMERRKP